jgi:hypothetical protein
MRGVGSWIRWRIEGGRGEMGKENDAYGGGSGNAAESEILFLPQLRGVRRCGKTDISAVKTLVFLMLMTTMVLMNPNLPRLLKNIFVVSGSFDALLSLLSLPLLWFQYYLSILNLNLCCRINRINACCML